MRSRPRSRATQCEEFKLEKQDKFKEPESQKNFKKPEKYGQS